MKAKRYLKLMTIIIAVSCLSMTACGNNRESGAVSKEEQISESMDTAVVSADTESGNAQSEDEKEPVATSEHPEYWYIGIRFRDMLGHEFYFLEPDEKGNPTKITISGFAEEINNGTFDFITEPNAMSPAETPDDPWIIGRIIGSGNLLLKDKLGDDQFRMIEVDIWFEEDTTNLDPTEASEPNVAESSSVDEILDAACGMYVEKQGDTIELVKTDEGYRFKTITLKTRDEHYNDGPDLSTEFGVNGEVEEFDGMNVTVTFQTELAADEGTAVINKDGFIELSLKSLNMPDYSGSFILQ